MISFVLFQDKLFCFVKIFDLCLQVNNLLGDACATPTDPLPDTPLSSWKCWAWVFCAWACTTSL